MIRRPPRSTLFPTRRSSDLVVARVSLNMLRSRAARREEPIGGRMPEPIGDRGDAIHDRRSEEHTSELQSRQDLVCRLLLEKKTPAATRAAGSGICTPISPSI